MGNTCYAFIIELFSFVFLGICFLCSDFYHECPQNKVTAIYMLGQVIDSFNHVILDKMMI